MSIIKVANITVDYGNQKGVFDVSFEVKKGEVLGFLGPNGAGKTTTIRQLMGFAKPDKGCCSILGMDCYKDAAAIQSHVGYLPGEIAFMNDLSGMGFIRFIADMKGIEDISRAKELIDMFELNTTGRIRKMSKGMKQKIGIVCAFMQDCEILILDEPTSGLDPLMQNRFIELIQQEKSRGKTILMSSHMFEEIERTCDRAAIIKEGRLVLQEGMEQLSEKQQKEFVVTFEKEEMAKDFCRKQKHAVLVNGRSVKVNIVGDMMPFLQLLTTYQVKNLKPAQQNLETIFMEYYGGKQHD